MGVGSFLSASRHPSTGDTPCVALHACIRIAAAQRFWRRAFLACRNCLNFTSVDPGFRPQGCMTNQGASGQCTGLTVWNPSNPTVCSIAYGGSGICS